MRDIMTVAAVVLLGATAAAAESGKALIKGTAAESPISGVASVTPEGDGIKVVVEIDKAPPGLHGLHIHQFGDCSEDGLAAGGHYNPDNMPHGMVTKDGLTAAHPGDLGNIEIGQDGSGRLEATIPGVNLSGGKYAVAGRTIVMHEKADDFSQPTGNAGGRIGCGPILIVGQ